MKKSELLTAACALSGADIDTVLKFRTDLVKDEAYLILDLGTQGCPKHTFYLGDLVDWVRRNRRRVAALQEARLATTEARKALDASLAEAGQMKVQIEATKQARALAEKEGIDLADLPPTQDGKVRINDVRAHIGRLVT